MTLKSSIALLFVLVLCLSLAAVGVANKCSKGEDQDQPLTIEQLPAAVRATLEAQAQGNPIEDIEKETEDGVTFYSADIIQGDKKLGVEIAEDGTLLNSEPEAIKGHDEDADAEGDEGVEADDHDDDSAHADGERHESGERESADTDGEAEHEEDGD